MNHQYLMEAFDRAKDQAREAWSAAEVVHIVDQLKSLTLDYIRAHQKTPSQPGADHAETS